MDLVMVLVGFVYRYRIYYLLSFNKESERQSNVTPFQKKTRYSEVIFSLYKHATQLTSFNFPAHNSVNM